MTQSRSRAMAPPPVNSIILSFLLLFFILPSTTLSERCNPKDKKVLLQIKKALNNPYHLASWNPKTDCCDWYCIECDLNTSRITALNIFSGQISGQIPAEVGDLPFLETLIFRKLSNLSGNIPPSVAKLKRLKTIRVSWTNISGEVPGAILSQLKNLNYLDLSFNNLSGKIPPSLSTLPNLGALHLDRNRLTGEIPEEFGNFWPNFPDLYLSHNQLSGPIPKSLGRLNFSTIDFSRNALEGDASMLFGTNKSVQIVDLSRNKLQFDLTNVEFPQSLTSLDLNHNQIFGSLPATLTDLELQYVNVSYNRLCGMIPVGGKLQSFDYSSYFHNKCLCGAPLASCKK
ncbi:polygalacturonase inhibitor-like [Malania oleifera]|uniref:polygalacturonase inhibitor-like n=1 Tax=Malania oleifera TaxID=397392 RepID=UPI0025AE0374|nr:polygalacturonase inhibitor-like [Malania oleifera]